MFEPSKARVTLGWARPRNFAIALVLILVAAALVLLNLQRYSESQYVQSVIAMIAAAAHALSGDAARATFWAANARGRNPVLSREDFCRSFPMKSDAMRVRVLRALGELGF